MRKEIKNAYDSVRPGEDVYDRIYQNVQAAQPRKMPRSLPRALTAAACVVLIAALSVAGYGAYERWRLPKPVPYTPDPDTIIYEVQTTETYTALPEPENEALTDGWFLSEAARVLDLAGLSEYVTPEATVTRQKHLQWNREEVHVAYADGGAEVRFDAERGYLLGITSIHWVDDAEGEPMSLPDVRALAEEYCAALPVPQGYKYTDCTEYDDQYWSLEFCREVEEGLYNQYEMVRIAINPINGALNGLNVFYVPLLDDHGPEDVPLTQEDAEAIVSSRFPDIPANRELVSANVGIALPNWFFTGEDITNIQYSAVTRLAWCLMYENPDSEFADKVYICIDLYTGEILGGDMT